MPYKCCVPKCRGNYDGGPKVSTFAFPKDTNMQKKWLKAICREDFTPNHNSRVCELHFKASEVERSTTTYARDTGQALVAPLKCPRLIKDVIPSKLPGCPLYLSKQEQQSREGPKEKRSRKENQALEVAVLESIASEEARIEADRLSSFGDFLNKIKSLSINNSDGSSWLISQRPDKVNFFLDEGVECIKLCVCVSVNLEANIFLNGVNIKLKNETFKVNSVCEFEKFLVDSCIVVGKSIHSSSQPDNELVKTYINLVDTFLNKISDKTPEKKSIVDFLKEQVILLGANSKYALRYSCETILFCGLLQSISPHGYKFLRGSNILTLPSEKTMKSLCGSLGTDPRHEQNTFLQYVATKFKLLKDTDKFVTLMVDEIHIFPYKDFKGGSVVGHAHDSTESATSAYAFMINSLLSVYKEVVHILPARTMKAETLHDFIKKIVIGLEDIGFEVIAVVSDNNRINRKAMSFFQNPPEITNSYPHPSDPTRPLFFVIDTVHLLKNIRNNWLNHKPLPIFTYPEIKDSFSENIGNEMQSDILNVASFNSLKIMHSKEKDCLLKTGNTLTLKSLYPTSIERQNVKLALQIFNYNTVVALRTLGPKIHLENYKETADFIELICKWWDIVNVKTLLKGQRNLNSYQQPVTKNSKHIFDLLNYFLNWLNKWLSSEKAKEKLSVDTHNALVHSTDALLQISKYCLEVKNLNFVLLGQIQTDKLEERFGKYRCQAGSMYHISIRQVFESESKLRIQSVVPLIIQSKKYGEIKITRQEIQDFIEQPSSESFGVSSNNIPDDFKNIPDIDESDLEEIDDNMWNPLVYVAGYSAYSALKKLKCNYCKFYLIEEEASNVDTSFISSTSRGGLCYPNTDVVLCVAFSYLVTKHTLDQNELNFLKCKCQRDIIKYLTRGVLKNISLFVGHSCEKHNIENILKILLHCISNILLNNYCKRQNDVVKIKNVTQFKRIKPGSSKLQ